MRFVALACDYDGTIASEGRVEDATCLALRRVRDSGRHVVLVTGRQLKDLLEIFPEHDVFSRIVAENGAVLYDPARRTEKLLAQSPPPRLVTALQSRGVDPLEVGRAIVATAKPHETAVLEAIRDLGLEWQVIFNKGSVMALPSGVNKASGLKRALGELGLSPHNCVGVGDAENDHAFLHLCECSVAVANALPALKEAADLVTAGEEGAGIRELAQQVVQSDLDALAPRLARHAIAAGSLADGTTLTIEPYGKSILVAGASGSGKSTFATGLIERLAAQEYQYCIVDPEGDYAGIDSAVVLGDAQHPPALAEVMDLLRNPEQHAVVNLVGMRVNERPEFFAGLLPRLQELRARVGRPHWIVIDEVHHLLPVAWSPGSLTLPRELSSAVMITVHPDQVSPAVLAGVDMVVAIGPDPAGALRGFCQATGRTAPPAPSPPGPGAFVAWRPADPMPPVVVHAIPAQSERRRHVRKYAEGELTADRSFYFRGPEGKLNLRAQNLMLFVQLGEGVDDDTWRHHLARGDYSGWLRQSIKDDELAAEVATIEAAPDRPAAESRAAVRAAIERRYTLPARPGGSAA